MQEERPNLIDTLLNASTPFLPGAPRQETGAFVAPVSEGGMVAEAARAATVGVTGAPDDARTLLNAVDGDLDAFRREVERRVDQVNEALATYRAQTTARTEELEMLRLAGQKEATGEAPDDRPDDVPPELADVRERVEKGELDWTEMFTGDTADAAARAVHLWMEPRMAVLRETVDLARHGEPVADAAEIAIRDIRPPGLDEERPLAAEPADEAEPQTMESDGA